MPQDSRIDVTLDIGVAPETLQALDSLVEHLQEIADEAIKAARSVGRLREELNDLDEQEGQQD